VNWADSVLHEVKVVDGDTLYDIHASIDHWHRRITPGYDSTRKSYALFFGCSVCFGTGCEDDGTLACAYQTLAGDCNAYNYGTAGWGTNHVLARFEHKDLKTEVPEHEGFAVYVFIWSHIRRNIGDLHTYTGWGHTAPYYELRNGRPERLGNFHDDRRFTSWIYEHVYDLNTVRYFDVEWPLRMSDDAIELTVALVERSRELYRRQFGNDRFYVLIYPYWKDYFDQRTYDRFLALLKAKGIIYFDHTGIVPLDGEHQIPLDGHPKPLTHQVIAGALINDLRALGVKSPTARTR
jgi:hypothetical protein